LLEPKQNAKTAVKRYYRFSQSQPVSAHVIVPPPSRWLGAQTADSDCDWLKQLKRFTAKSVLFWPKQNSFGTALFQFYFNCADSFRLPLRGIRTDKLTWWSMFGFSANRENVHVIRNMSSMPNPSARNGSI